MTNPTNESIGRPFAWCRAYDNDGEPVEEVSFGHDKPADWNEAWPCYRARELDREQSANNRQAQGEWGGYEAFEQFLAAEIDSAPEALRRLGEWLGNVLDEDHFATANRLVLGAMLETSDAIRKVAASKAAPQPPAQEQEGDKNED